MDQPHFAEPTTSADLRSFTDRKPDAQYYKFVNAHLLQPIPVPRDPGNMTLSLAQVWGSAGRQK